MNNRFLHLKQISTPRGFDMEITKWVHLRSIHSCSCIHIRKYAHPYADDHCLNVNRIRTATKVVWYQINIRIIKNLATHFLKCVLVMLDYRKACSWHFAWVLQKRFSNINNNIINSTLISTKGETVGAYAQLCPSI